MCVMTDVSCVECGVLALGVFPAPAEKNGGLGCTTDICRACRVSSRAGCASALPFGRLFFGNCTVKMAVKMDPTKLKSCPTRCHVVETRPVPARIRVLFESPLRVRSGSPALASHTPSLLSPLLSRRSKSQVDRPVRWRLRPQGGTLPYSAPRHGSANSPTAPAATPSRVPT